MNRFREEAATEPGTLPSGAGLQSVVEDPDLTPELPQVLAEMAEVVSLATVATIVDHYGGRELYIPSRADGTHKLVELIGAEDLAALVGRFGGETLYLPRADRARRLVRDHHIRQLKEAGSTVDELAQRFGLTTRQVFNILSKPREQQA